MLTRVAMLRRLREYLPAVALLAPLFLLVVIPLAALIYASLIQAPPRPGVGLQPISLENYRRALSAGNFEATINSLILSTGGTLLALLFGGGLAWLAARTDVPARLVVQLSGITALFMSSLVGAVAWSILASPRRGLLNLILEDIGLPWRINIYTMEGMILVFGIYYAPYAFLFLYSALTLVNPESEEAAVVHGATTFKAATQVTLPSIAPAILGAALLSFVLIMETFSIPAILGTPGGISTLPTLMFRLMNLVPPAANEAAALGIVFTIVVAAVIGLQRRVTSGREYTTLTGKGFATRRIRLGKWRWPALGLAAVYLVISVILPFGGLALIALRPHPFIRDTADMFDINALGLGAFGDVLGSEFFWLSFRNSVTVGVFAAAVGLVMYLSLAYVVDRMKVRGRYLLEQLTMAPLAVPAVVMSLAILWTWYTLPVPLYGTLAILVLAYVARFLPQGFRSVGATIVQVHPELEESARVAGATRLLAAWEILLPLMRSGLVGTALLILVLSIRELSAALFLFTSRTRVMSILIFDLYDGGGLGRAAVVALAYSGLLLVVVLVARRWMSTPSA